MDFTAQIQIVSNIVVVLAIAVVPFIAVVLAIDLSKVEPVAEVKIQRTKTRIWLLISSFVWGGCLVLSPAVIIATAMGFTSPSSAKNPVALLFFWSMVVLPFICLFSIYLSWILYSAKKNSAARLFSLLPLVNIILLLLIFLVSFLVATFG